MMGPDDGLLFHKKKRAHLKGEYKRLLESTSALLFRHDPIDLDYETNVDEYDSEARTVLPRLISCRSAEDVERVLHEEFCRWFTAETAGPQERYRAAAVELWQLWQVHKPTA